MGTLAFDASFSKTERVILSKTFKQNCIDLGIAKRSFMAQVRRYHIGPTERHAVVAHPSDDFFMVELNKNGFNMFDATFALGHEAIHMHQRIMGYYKPALPFGMMWKGRIVPVSFIENPDNYEDLPWEQEAHAMDCKLHISAIHELTDEEKEICHIRHSNGGPADEWLEMYESKLRKAA